jgi:hypothetical protein
MVGGWGGTHLEQLGLRVPKVELYLIDGRLDFERVGREILYPTRVEAVACVCVCDCVEREGEGERTC